MLLNTARVPWVSLRGATVTASEGTPLSSFKYSDWPSSNVLNLNTPDLHDASGVLIAFHGSDAADEDSAFILYGRSRSNGPIQCLLTGEITLGTQNCTIDPIDGATAITNGEWVDTITITGGILSGIVEILDSGNNRIAMLMFDQMHIEDLHIEFDMDGGDGSEATSMYAIITGY